MSKLFILNRRDELQCILSNEGDDSCLFWDAPYEADLTGVRLFEFKTLANHELSEHIVELNQVMFYDRENKLRLFKIESVEYETDADGDYIQVYCQSAKLELLNHIIEDRRPNNQTMGQMLQLVLDGTRYQVGNMAPLGTQSTSFFMLNGIECINQIANLFGAEIEERIEFGGRNITGRFIDLPSRLGIDTGKVLTLTQDVISMSKTVQTAHMATALIGRGSSLQMESDEGVESYSRRIMFGDVEWSVANGDPLDKPLGQIYLEDPEATILYGLPDGNQFIALTDLSEHNQQEDPEQLLWDTYRDLQRRIQRHYNFSMSIFMLGDLIGYEAHKINLGDTVRTVNRNFKTDIGVESRIIKVVYDVADPQDVADVELGHFINLFAEQDRLDRLETEIGIIGSRPLPDIDENLIIGEPNPVTDFRAQGLFASINLHWSNQTLGINFRLHASHVEGFVPSSANMIYRGVANGFNHSEGVNVGQMWYYRIQAEGSNGSLGPMSEEVSAQTQQIPEWKLEDNVRESINTARDNADAALGRADEAINNANDAFDRANDALTATSDFNSRIDDLIQVMEDFDLDNLVDLVEAIEGGLDELLEALDEIGARVEVAEGQASLALQTAQGFEQIVLDLETDLRSQIVQTASEIMSRVESAEGDLAQLNIRADGIASRVEDAEDNITTVTQLATGLQTTVIGEGGINSQVIQLNNLWSTVIEDPDTGLTARIDAMPDFINLQVENMERDIINRINISDDGILIDGSNVWISGQTRIDDAVILDAHIHDLSVSKLTAGDFNADWITAGTLRAIDIFGVNIAGSEFRSELANSSAVINGGQIVLATRNPNTGVVGNTAATLNHNGMHFHNPANGNQIASVGALGAGAVVFNATAPGTMFDFRNQGQTQFEIGVFQTGWGLGNRSEGWLQGRGGIWAGDHAFFTQGATTTIGTGLGHTFRIERNGVDRWRSVELHNYEHINIGGEMRIRNVPNTGWMNLRALGIIEESSRHSKTNFDDVENALDIINDTKIFKYNTYSDIESGFNHTKVGVIAEDAHDLIRREHLGNPDVEGDEFDAVGVDLGSMIGLAWGAIQELNKKIESLENEIQQLKSAKIDRAMFID